MSDGARQVRKVSRGVMERKRGKIGITGRQKATNQRRAMLRTRMNGVVRRGMAR